MKKIKAIIFDIGGVFLEQKKGYMGKVLRFFQKNGDKT